MLLELLGRLETFSTVLVKDHRLLVPLRLQVVLVVSGIAASATCVELLVVLLLLLAHQLVHLRGRRLEPTSAPGAITARATLTTLALLCVGGV